MSGSGQWSDLRARVLSAIVMVIVGFAAIWAGGDIFNLFIAASCGAMMWELLRMLAPDKGSVALWMGVVSAGAVLASAYLPAFYVLPVLLAPALAAAGQISAHRSICLPYAMWITLAGFGMIVIRGDFGLATLLWLICVVVATDVAGYFAGRLIGGPKFWPRVSPKKTWSGTVAGWIAAALVGWGFASTLGNGGALVLLSVVLSMASQAGDVAESAIKRKVDVKDSSNLIPGHGGFLDRFDGMLGASALFLLVGVFLLGGSLGAG